MVSLERVTKSFGGRVVVKRATVTALAGQRLALVGPSGCGKSTLLKMILGLVVPDEGSVRVADACVTPANAREVRRRIGYVIQDGGLFPHLTARENVTLVARLSGMDRARVDARTDELADLARLPRARLDRYPRELSGGERQRVGLMRALMLDPEVLLLDEPLGALDPVVRARLQEDLRSAFEALGKCVVLVTHDMAEAAYLAGAIVVMRDGAILQTGTMRELASSPADPYVTELLGAQRTLAEAIG
jgi:osmoprotectant transport system ATP-binding protein